MSQPSPTAPPTKPHLQAGKRSPQTSTVSHISPCTLSRNILSEMRTQPLPFHNPRKRKRDSADEGSSPVAPPFLQATIPGDRAAPDNGRKGSPHAVMTDQLEDLDIHAQTPNSIEEVRSRGQTPIECREEVDDTHIEPSTEIPLPAEEKRGAKMKEGASKDLHGDSEALIPSTPSKRRTKSKQLSHPTPKKRRKSPPLTSEREIDPLTWHESEITGYDPADPADDGYGINGIGFKPTAAMAWERSQRRQKQVEEWKKREAREARERRKEKRDGLLPEDAAAASPSKKKVTFVT